MARGPRSRHETERTRRRQLVGERAATPRPRCALSSSPSSGDHRSGAGIGVPGSSTARSIGASRRRRVRGLVAAAPDTKGMLQKSGVCIAGRATRDGARAVGRDQRDVGTPRVAGVEQRDRERVLASRELGAERRRATGARASSCTWTIAPSACRMHSSYWPAAGPLHSRSCASDAASSAGCSARYRSFTTRTRGRRRRHAGRRRARGSRGAPSATAATGQAPGDEVVEQRARRSCPASAASPARGPASGARAARAGSSNAAAGVEQPSVDQRRACGDVVGRVAGRGVPWASRRGRSRARRTAGST